MIVSERGGLSINIRSASNIDLALLRQRSKKAGIKLYFAKEYSGGGWDAIGACLGYLLFLILERVQIGFCHYAQPVYRLSHPMLLPIIP
jgi:hypothetical protein